PPWRPAEGPRSSSRFERRQLAVCQHRDLDDAEALEGSQIGLDALVPARLPPHRLFPLVERRIPDPRLGTAAVQQPGDGQPELASIFDLLVELGDGGVVTDDLLAAPATSQTVDRPDHDGVDEGL